MKRNRNSTNLLRAGVVSLWFAVLPASAAAQSPASQAVVQPLPPAGVANLNSALRRLARNSQNVDALIDAGNASLKVGDVDAAIGFFGRADELSPNNPRVKVGLAAAYTRKQRPLDALRLFDEAERAGASTSLVAADRGLAYDLVGDNASARMQYQAALSASENATTRRRLALSHAIAGDRTAFETTLAPLIAAQNAGSYRTRAFGLAILGDDAEAVAIAEAVMPRNLSAQIAPYLRYMPRLTAAQQAAAANLGIFPRAAQIGRDNPQIAQYTASSSAGQNAGARLAPQGEPLGRREDTTSPRRRPDRSRSAVVSDVAEKPAAAAPALASAARVNRRAASDPSARSSSTRRARVVRSEVVKPEASPALANKASDAPAEVAVVQPTPTPDPTPTSTPASSTSVAEVNAGFDLANVESEPNRAAPGPTPAPTPLPTAAQAEEKTVVQAVPESVADAFANFSLQPRTGVAVDTGGVDIRTIKPPREVEKKPEPEAKPEPPKHPKRFWVQVATGRDRNALKFDWRRISRKASDVFDGKSGFTAPWGQSNRLLSGPYDNLRAAQRAVTALKAEGVDSFTFTSASGEEITPIK